MIEREWVGEDQLTLYEAELAATRSRDSDAAFRAEIERFAPLGLRSTAQLAMYAADERVRLQAAQSLVRFKLDLAKVMPQDPLEQMFAQLTAEGGKDASND